MVEFLQEKLIKVKKYFNTFIHIFAHQITIKTQVYAHH